MQAAKDQPHPLAPTHSDRWLPGVAGHPTWAEGHFGLPKATLYLLAYSAQTAIVAAAMCCGLLQ